MRLNPFDIRATAWTPQSGQGRSQRWERRRRRVLIPLISGQLLGHIMKIIVTRQNPGLNPFDIRATAWTFSGMNLNPVLVLIPLISGQLLGQRSERALAAANAS